MSIVQDTPSTPRRSVIVLLDRFDHLFNCSIGPLYPLLSVSDIEPQQTSVQSGLYN